MVTGTDGVGADVGKDDGAKDFIAVIFKSEWDFCSNDDVADLTLDGANKCSAVDCTRCVDGAARDVKDRVFAGTGASFDDPMFEAKEGVAGGDHGGFRDDADSDWYPRVISDIAGNDAGDNGSEETDIATTADVDSTDVTDDGASDDSTVLVLAGFNGDAGGGINERYFEDLVWISWCSKPSDLSRLEQIKCTSHRWLQQAGEDDEESNHRRAASERLVHPKLRIRWDDQKYTGVYMKGTHLWSYWCQLRHLWSSIPPLDYASLIRVFLETL